MSWRADTININKVLEHLDQHLEGLFDLCNKLNSEIEGSENLDQIRTASQLITCEVGEFMRSWSNYSSTYREAVEKDLTSMEEKMNQQSQELAETRCRLNDALGEINRLMEIISKHPSDEVISRCLGLLDEVETNVKVISLQRKLKDPKRDRHGTSAPMWRHDVNNDELIMDYQLSGNKITKQMIEKYKLTQPAIRTRLIELGVYESKWSKN